MSEMPPGRRQAENPTDPEGSTGGRRTGGGKIKKRNGQSNVFPFLADELAELSNNPQFQALRQLIQQNPEQLQTLMQTLQASQPELFQVKQREKEILTFDEILCLN